MVESMLKKYGPELVEVRRPVWVSKVNADVSAGGWKLTGANANQGHFDAIVIAHNGKCANRCGQLRMTLLTKLLFILFCMN